MGNLRKERLEDWRHHIQQKVQMSSGAANRRNRLHKVQWASRSHPHARKLTHFHPIQWEMGKTELEKPSFPVSGLKTSDIVEGRVEMLTWKQGACILNGETPLSLFPCRSHNTRLILSRQETGGSSSGETELPKEKRSTDTDKEVTCQKVNLTPN